MSRNLSLIVAGALTLAACQQETIVAGEQPDPMKDELAKAPPVELPPAIAASKTYRCKDNSLVRIDWLQGGKGANLRVGDASTPTALRSSAPTEGSNEVAAADSGLTAEGGYALKGDATASSVTLTLPGKGAQACHV